MVSGSSIKTGRDQGNSIESELYAQKKHALLTFLIISEKLLCFPISPMISFTESNHMISFLHSPLLK